MVRVFSSETQVNFTGGHDIVLLELKVSVRVLFLISMSCWKESQDFEHLLGPEVAGSASKRAYIISYSVEVTFSHN
jgi:hypothetical protein